MSEGIKIQSEPKFLDSLERLDLLSQYRDAQKRLLLLDYDGTLVPFANMPQEAAPNNELYELLERLTNDAANTVYIISGRDSHTLEKWLGMLPLNIVAEHGAKIKYKNGTWIDVAPEDASWKEKVQRLMERFVHRNAQSFIEHKDFSLAWHYRNAAAAQAGIDVKELIKEVEHLAATEPIQLLNGNKVIEVRNTGINKGAAVSQITEEVNADFIIAIGDDTTDEDMFLQLADVPHAYTLKVGSEPSFARYSVYTPYMVCSLLQLLGEIKK